MRIILEYIIVFIVVALCYYLVIARKNKKYNKKNIPIELAYLIYIYNIDPHKINFSKFNITCSLINAFIISFTYIIVMYLVKDFIFQLGIGIVLLLLLIIICYGVLARIYLKRGMEKNVQLQRNRK